MANTTRHFVASKYSGAGRGYSGHSQEALFGASLSGRKLRRKLEKWARKAGKGKDDRK